MAKEQFFKYKFIRENEDYTPASEYEILLNKGHLMIYMYSSWDGLEDSIKFKVIEGTFISELREREIYEVAELLDFHLEYYVTNGGESQKMIKYLRTLFKNVKEGNLYPDNTKVIMSGGSSETSEQAADRFKKLASQRIDEGLKWCDIKEDSYNELAHDEIDEKATLNLSHKQKVLLTYYFQEHLNFPRATDLNLDSGKFNKFLSHLFSYNEKNTELYFNNVSQNSEHNPVTVKNIQKMIEIFRELGLDEHIPQLEDDLRKVRERKTRKE